MDMDFGISLDPSSVPQRHALYDSDEEDDEAQVKQADLVFSPPNPDITHPAILIVAIGQTACIFVKSHFTLTPLCSLEASTQAVFKGTCFPASEDQPCSVSETLHSEGSRQTLFCLHEKNLKSEHVNTWCKKLLDMFHPSSIVVLTSLPVYNHLSLHSHDLSHQRSFLRTIITSSWEHPLFEGATPLEPPNTLSGEPAAVMTACQVHRIPAAMLVLYMVSSESMTEQVTRFTPVINHPLLASLPRKSSGEVSMSVKSLEPKPREDLSTLYT